LKAKIVENEVVVARQCHSKHVSAATNQHTTTEEWLEVAFSMWYALKLYSEEKWEPSSSKRRPHFETCACLGQNKSWSWISRRQARNDCAVSKQWHFVVGHEESSLLAGATYQ
jgi:hypothetical protein